MNNRARNILYTIFLLASVYVVYTIRKKPDESRISFAGRTMGTTYSVIYYDDQHRNLQASVDSLLVVFNQSLNTYLTDSEISRFNTGNSLRYDLPFFYPVLKRSKEIYESCGGAFDPTVMPLVNAWGFGPAKPLDPDSAQVDSLLEFVGMDKIHFNEDSVWKEDPRVQLDFSAIAKGYGVDVVAGFLKDKGIDNLFVEIGGEVITSGSNVGERRAWQVGILDPNSTLDEQSYIAIAQLEDMALATSGNYFNFRIENGKKFSHTIDPDTGYPVQRTILSASVFAKNCMTADAWATAFMVMGEQRAKEVLNTRDDINAFLTYSKEDGSVGTYATPGLGDILRLNRKEGP
ncbi:MAG TPA: FAD:protein FMN transferase [Cyclobacteriaceae bacterium]